MRNKMMKWPFSEIADVLFFISYFIIMIYHILITNYHNLSLQDMISQAKCVSEEHTSNVAHIH